MEWESYSTSFIFEPLHDKSNDKSFALCEDTNQPGRPPSQIRVLMRTVKTGVNVLCNFNKCRVKTYQTWQMSGMSRVFV